MHQKIQTSTLFAFLLVTAVTCYTFTPTMKCSYGERGSLTATCVNATPSFFRQTPYRFDHLDETVRCVSCNLDVISPNTFDISGNQIITLDLQNSNITKLSASSFVGLVYMKNLLLANNKIKTISPGTFTGVRKVLQLNLANNNITMLIGDGFAELSNLTELCLENNLIRTVDSNAFNGLASLQELHLQNNQITDLKDVFLGLHSIQTLDLSNNLISQIRPLEINLTTLLDLNLAQNRLKTLQADIFLQLSNLVKLNLSNNSLETIEKGAFRGLKSLEFLDLENNALSYLEMSVFIRLYNLRELNLPYNSLTVLGTGAFTLLPELRYLNVSHNKIAGMERTGTKNLYNLHSLDISNNKFTYLDYKSLITHAPKLVFINIENNAWPCYLIEEMEDFFKGDHIEFTIDDKYEKLKTTCNVSVEKPNEIASEIAKLEAVAEPEQSSNNFYVLYSLIFILVGLIAVLFYIQYRTFSLLKGSGGGGRDISEVHLISSSGLENRDNEY